MIEGALKDLLIQQDILSQAEVTVIRTERIRQELKIIAINYLLKQLHQRLKRALLKRILILLLIQEIILNLIALTMKVKEHQARKISSR